MERCNVGWLWKRACGISTGGPGWVAHVHPTLASVGLDICRNPKSFVGSWVGASKLRNEPVLLNQYSIPLGQRVCQLQTVSMYLASAPDPHWGSGPGLPTGERSIPGFLCPPCLQTLVMLLKRAGEKHKSECVLHTCVTWLQREIFSGCSFGVLKQILNVLNFVIVVVVLLAVLWC